jgi:hypothetical protein
MNNQNDYIEAAQQIIVSLGLPRAQQNERSALCLLALLNLTPGKNRSGIMLLFMQTAHKAWAGCAKTRKQADNLSVRASTNGADYIAIIKKE